MRLSFDITPWEVKMLSDMFNEEEQKDDDAEDEQCDCDDESAEEACDDAECEAHRKALDELAKCLRASGVADVTFHYCGDAKWSNGKR